ncbi:hypothetical protein NOR_07924 [Metarhizium rileyi]|uniref:Uncharacterized protein n=1 Tax=Metarhizium rileyi (strain RCEF 4871) TaxID=1649241 RepID=A0A166X8K2_METRR|nr:hypothetical protein NOR_07924 [Metarhizium rileyi RCEF 4871]
MSRNIRQKYPAKTAKKASQRRGSDASSSFDLSGDDGYSAVEEISDSSDDDEEDVDAVEERNILTEAKPSQSPRPQPDNDNDDDDDDNNEDDGDDEYDCNHSVVDPDAEESTSWAGIASEVDESQASDLFHDPSFGSDPAVERHVHFDVPSSDSDSTDTDDDDHGDLFPDIFVSQTSLDPAFRREIEHDPDESSGSGSFWDYNGQYEQQHVDDSDAEDVIRELSDEETPIATPRVSQIESSPSKFPPTLEEPLDLDGYETDGDTTEEDIPDPPIRRKTRHPSVPISEVSDSDAPSPIKSHRGQPRVGRFNLDRSDKKPIAVLNPLTRKMMIFTPHRRRQLDLSPEQFNFTWALEEQSDPIFSNSANLMLSAMFSSNTLGDLINPQTMGPTEAFFPFPSETGTADEGSSPSFQDEEDEVEKKLDISDFITWDDGNSSGDEGNDGTWEPSSTPVRPTTASSDRDVLSHLNSDTVGAFRRNQINQQLILSNKATQDSLAFSGPYNYSAIRGLKSDRFDTAGIPLTPIRRQKKHASDVTRSPLESVAAKRKASNEAGNGHKRHRSISDVNLLRI